MVLVLSMAAGNANSQSRITGCNACGGVPSWWGEGASGGGRELTVGGGSPSGGGASGGRWELVGAGTSDSMPALNQTSA